MAELHGVETGVEAACGDQLGVATELDEAAGDEVDLESADEDAAPEADEDVDWIDPAELAVEEP